MSVDGTVVACRLRVLGVCHPDVEGLLEQLGPQMSDSDYRAVTIAIIHVLSRSLEMPAARFPAAGGREAGHARGSTRQL